MKHLGVPCRDLYQLQQENNLAQNICKSFEGREKANPRFYTAVYYLWYVDKKHCGRKHARKPSDETGLGMDLLQKYLLKWAEILSFPARTIFKEGIGLFYIVDY